MVRKVLLLLLVLTFVSAAFIWAGGKQEAGVEEEMATPEKTEILLVHQENPPKKFMPLTTKGREAEYVFELIFGRLNQVDAEGKTIGSMADRWELSQDNLTWTFHLRKDVTWHDGRPFTSKDVEFTIYTYLNKAIGYQWAANYMSILGANDYYEGNKDTIPGVKSIDDHTIAFTTDGPNAAFPSVFISCKIIPEHIWRDVEKTEDAYIQTANKQGGMIGTGPFKFVRYVTDEYLELERFDDYFMGTPRLKKVIIQFAPVNTGMAMLETGEIDLVYEIPFEDIERVNAISGIEVEEVPNAKWIWFIRYNHYVDSPSPIRDFLLNPKFIKAITMAFDRQAYVDSVLLGHGQVVDTNAYSIPWAVPPDFKPTPYDPEEAKKILEEIGWDFAKNSIRILVYPSNKARNQIPIVLQNYLMNIGVKSEVITKDLAAARVDINEAHDFDILVGGWLQGADPSLWAPVLASKELGGGLDGYGVPEVDRLFEKGIQTFDFKERQKIYWEMVRIIQKNMSQTNVVLPNVVIARTSRLKNFILSPERGLGARFIDIHKWYITVE